MSMFFEKSTHASLVARRQLELDDLGVALLPVLCLTNRISVDQRFLNSVFVLPKVSTTKSMKSLCFSAIIEYVYVPLLLRMKTKSCILRSWV